MNLVWHLLSDTPWWVYLILVLLINIGVRASRNQVIALKKLFIMPAFFTVLSLHTLATSVAITSLNIGSWLIALLASAALGWRQVAQYKLKVDRENGLLKVPGTWSTLCIILAIFAIKYYFGYQLAVKPHLLGDPGFEMQILIVTGLTTGFFLGKLTCYLYRFRKEPSVDLV